MLLALFAVLQLFWRPCVAAANVPDILQVEQATATGNNGYPFPGQQERHIDQVFDNVYFTNDEEWKEILEQSHQFDYIVIGSSLTAFGFVHEVLELNPFANILIIERGGFLLPQHIQMTPLPLKYAVGALSETFPWTLTEDMVESSFGYIHGAYPCIGGKSLLWSGWSPIPKSDQLSHWPPTLLHLASSPNAWKRAQKLLRVKPADEIQDSIYSKLQKDILTRLKPKYREHESSVDYVYEGPLAVGNDLSQAFKYNKFSTPGPLIQLMLKQKKLSTMAPPKGSPLTIVSRCVVQKLLTNEDKTKVLALQTSKGNLTIGNAKVVIAAGTIPTTTLVLNAFGEKLPLAGTKLKGHLISRITARVPKSSFTGLSERLEMAALYIDGHINQFEYHIQFTAISTTTPHLDFEDIERQAPDHATAVNEEQLYGSEDYVVFACGILGEVDSIHDTNWVRLNPNDPDPTTNVYVQLLPSEQDQENWNAMELASIQVLRALADPHTNQIEFWDPNTKAWKITPPSHDDMHAAGIVHEAGTLWIGDDPKNSVVGLDFRPHGVDNVYVTGGALFPSVGSWNPTLTMVLLSQELARQVTTPSCEEQNRPDSIDNCPRI